MNLEQLLKAAKDTGYVNHSQGVMVWRNNGKWAAGFILSDTDKPSDRAFKCWGETPDLALVALENDVRNWAQDALDRAERDLKAKREAMAAFPAEAQ